MCWVHEMVRTHPSVFATLKGKIARKIHWFLRRGSCSLFRCHGQVNVLSPLTEANRPPRRADTAAQNTALAHRPVASLFDHQPAVHLRPPKSISTSSSRANHLPRHLGSATPSTRDLRPLLLSWCYPGWGGHFSREAVYSSKCPACRATGR